MSADFDGMLGVPTICVAALTTTSYTYCKIRSIEMLLYSAVLMTAVRDVDITTVQVTESKSVTKQRLG